MKKKGPTNNLLLLHLLGFVFWLFAGASSMQAQVTAAFDASTVAPCQGETVSFTNLSVGPVTSYTWQENGTTFTTATSPTRTFNVPGSYVISLIASSAGGPDTANTLVVVTPSPGSSGATLNASCFGLLDGEVDLSPSPGVPNVSVCFDGSDDFIQANSIANTSFASGMTIEAWVKPEATWLSGDGMVFSSNTVGGGNNFLFSYNTTIQKFIWFDDVAGNRLQSGIAARGQWHHVVVTITSTNLVTMYVNGNVVQTFATSPNWRPVPGDLWSMGQEWDGLSTSQHLNGCVDEARVWSTPLSATLVNDNFNNSCGSIADNHPNIASLTAYYSMNEGLGNFTFDRSGNNNHGAFNGSVWGPPPGNDFGCFSEGTGYAYNWSNGATTENLTNVGAGSYQVTVTDGAGCTVLDTFVITEPPQIIYTAAAAPDDTLCIGDSVDIVTTGSYTFTYSPAASLSAPTGSTVTAFPTSTTTYEVVAQDGFGCRDTVDLTLTVNPLPVPAIAGTDTICEGDTTNLVASGGTLYQWSTGDAVASIDVAPVVDSTFGVLVTDANGCQAVTSLQVTVFAAPTASIAGIDTICFGTPTTLTASGGNSYNWSTGAMTAAVTVSPIADSSFAVVVTDGNGCTDSDSQTVVVNALPTVDITGDDTICAGDPAALTATGGVSYVWTSGDLVPMISVSPAVSTTYGVLATDGNNCQNGDTLRVIVNALPIPAIAGDTAICLGDTAQLTASGGLSYAWNVGDTTAGISVTPSSNTNYVVVVTDGNGCNATDSLEVGVFSLPVISFAGDTVICIGDTAQLTAAGGSSFVWSSGDMTAGISVTPLSNTTYSVVATNGNNCSSQDSVAVMVNPLPVVSITGDTLVCVGDTAMLVASGGTSYNWSSGDATAGTNVVPTANTVYTVDVTDGNGCSDMGSIQVMVNALPVMSIVGQDTSCSGDTIMLMASGASDLVWSTGDTTTSIEVAPMITTNYDVVGTDVNGCSGTTDLNVFVNALPTVGILGPDSICEGESPLLTGSGAIDYVWSTGDNAGDITVSPIGDTTFTVTGTDANGCANSATQAIVVNALPSTPNIFQGGNILNTVTGFPSYQWFLNGNPIPGANTSSYVYDSSGTYTVEVINGNGCAAISDPFDFLVGTIDVSGGLSFDIYPNPNQGQFTVRIESEKSRSVEIQLVDILGHVILTEQVKATSGTWTHDIDSGNISQGVYLLQVKAGDLQAIQRMVIR